VHSSRCLTATRGASSPHAGEAGGCPPCAPFCGHNGLGNLCPPSWADSRRVWQPARVVSMLLWVCCICRDVWVGGFVGAVTPCFFVVLWLRTLPPHPPPLPWPVPLTLLRTLALSSRMLLGRILETYTSFVVSVGRGVGGGWGGGFPVIGGFSTKPPSYAVGVWSCAPPAALVRLLPRTHPHGHGA
jgi:hypothetical protein